MRKTRASLLALLLLPSLLSAQSRSGRTLDIYFIDTEGGQATLYVAPSGLALLVDAGNPGGRDTDRIMTTLAAAGVKALDYLMLTHYHVDHVGGVQELAKRIPIRHFVDHGPTAEPNEQVAGFAQAYAELYRQAGHTVVKPGDKLAVAGLDWYIVTAAGKALTTPLPGAGGPNPSCAGVKPQESTHDENGQSLGFVVAYGKFRTINLGDLLWNNELDLVCPNNLVGTVDLYLTSHHGLAQSGSPPLVYGIQPRVAIMNNGTRKGGAVQTFQTLHGSPGLEDLWLLHWSYSGGLEHNPAGVFIANVDDAQTIAGVITAPPPAGTPGGGSAHTGPAYLIKVSAKPDGSFTVSNTRNGFSKTYKAKG
jgi:competence protein ComEC